MKFYWLSGTTEKSKAVSTSLVALMAASFANSGDNSLSISINSSHLLKYHLRMIFITSPAALLLLISNAICMGVAKLNITTLHASCVSFSSLGSTYILQTPCIASILADIIQWWTCSASSWREGLLFGVMSFLFRKSSSSRSKRDVLPSKLICMRSLVIKIALLLSASCSIS